MSDALYYVSAKGAILFNGRILLLKSRKFADYPYDLPGGRMHEYDNIKETLYREIQDELGLKASEFEIVEELGGFVSHKHIHNEVNEFRGSVYFVYVCRLTNNGVIQLNSEHEDPLWCTREEFVRLYGPMEPQIVKRLQPYL